MQQRNGTTVCLLGIVTCTFYYWYWLYQTAEEMRGRGLDMPPWWMLIISPLQYLFMWKWAEGFAKLTNQPQAGTMTFIYLACLGPIAPILLQPKLNEIK
ncbi:MAG: DUF4234 domain-containing protein [Polyangiaceae bacterium]|nr:DUF4234 domain-containing protein [Polyangiaceae bacterium]